jgi:hypothetical protein
MPRADWARRTSYVSSSSFWGERDLTQAQEVILAHQSQHPFVIGLPVFAPEQSGNPPVAIVAMSDCQALNGTIYEVIAVLFLTGGSSLRKG